MSTRSHRARRPAALLAAALAIVLAAVTACSGGSAGTGASSGAGAAVSSGAPTTVPSGAGGPLPAAPRHVVVVVMENHGYSSVVGRPDAPWLNGLPAAVLTGWHGVTHPSQPNYLALLTGSTHGVTDDHCPVTVDGPDLAHQLLAAGRSFVGYSEGLPGAGSTVCRAGRYARKHNPWVDVTGLPAATNQPLTALPTDWNQLPTVAFVVPDLCHDTHDCPTRTGDEWLRRTLGGYADWARTHDSLLVVTYDEDDGSARNHIPTFLVGASVRPGRYAVRGDHYTLLRTLEAFYRLPGIGSAADRTPLTGMWR